MEFITYEQEGFVGVVTINRPKALNALNSQVLDELEATFDAMIWIQQEPYFNRRRREVICCRSRYRRDEHTYKGRGRSIR